MSSGGDDDVLPALVLVGHRCGLPASRERILPEQLTGFDIEGAEDGVEGGADEDEPATRRGWPAETGRTPAHRVWHDGRIRDQPQRHLPSERAVSQIYRRERAPRRWAERQHRLRVEEEATHQCVRRAELLRGF